MITRLIIPTFKEEAFIKAYIEAIFFTETGDLHQPQSDSKLDESFERESIIDCLAFYSMIELYLSPENISQAGHDFWLTRNRHGTGFWDRGDLYGKYSQKFTDLAHTFGEVSVCFDSQAVWLKENLITNKG